ncbi:MAG: HD domain-containing protein [Akkermansia sp.]
MSMIRNPRKTDEEIRTIAVIYLGPNSMCLIVTEVTQGEVRMVDFLTQPVPLARDIFRMGRISRHTMDRCVQVMGDYMDILKEYGTGAILSTRFMMSNIISEAANVDVFVNRMHVAHDVRGRIIDDGRMTRLIYVKVQETLAQYPDFQKKNTMVVHVGPGNTRILLFEKGRITRYSCHRLGSHRTGEAVGEIDFGSDAIELSVLREHARGQIDQIGIDYRFLKNLDGMIIVGAEMQRLCHWMALDDKGLVTLDEISREAERMATMTLEQRMLEYDADFAEADSLLPAIMINLTIAQNLSPDRIIIPSSSYEEEFLISLIRAEQHPGDLEDEVLHFAGLLADRYMADRSHRSQVVALCDDLFEQLTELHRLNEHDQLLLQVAAILHEIGGFISQNDHHKHSEYLILNSEIFGLSREDVEIVALIARFHRHETPSKTDDLYTDLDQTDRMRVSKMAAILRVADALERGHSRRIKSIKAHIRGKNLELEVVGVRDTTVEELAIRLKGDLFSDIFGYDIVLIPST